MFPGVVKESICHRRIFFLTSSELGFALKDFVLKVILFFVIEFLVCRLVERGFFPTSPYLP